MDGFHIPVIPLCGWASIFLASVENGTGITVIYNTRMQDVECRPIGGYNKS